LRKESKKKSNCGIPIIKFVIPTLPIFLRVITPKVPPLASIAIVSTPDLRSKRSLYFAINEVQGYGKG